jgi:hypothetical protein
VSDRTFRWRAPQFRKGHLGPSRRARAPSTSLTASLPRSTRSSAKDQDGESTSFRARGRFAAGENYVSLSLISERPRGRFL